MELNLVNLVEGNNLTEDYMKTRGQLLGKEVRRRIFLGHMFFLQVTMMHIMEKRQK